MHSTMFYNPAFYPKAVGYKLTRQVFWLVLLNCVLPKFLQWICAIRCYQRWTYSYGNSSSIYWIPF